MAIKANGARNSSAIHIDTKLITHLKNTLQQNSQNFYTVSCVKIRQQQKSKSTKKKEGVTT
jgi:hypothetical protein|tara:strand:+ start:805 stop:987 length:183 start_codon:yes stop_codon:yes gene_type:complete